MASRERYESGDYLCDLGEFSDWYKSTYRPEFRKRWKEYRKWLKSKYQEPTGIPHLEAEYAAKTERIAYLHNMSKWQAQLTPSPTHAYRISLKAMTRTILHALRENRIAIQHQRKLP